MNRIGVAVSVLCASLLLFGTPAAAELKVGFVNMDRVEQEAPQVEAVRNKLQREFAPRDRELVSQQKGLKKLEDKLSRDGAVMSESQRRKLERDILSARRDLKRAQDEFRDDLNIRRNEELGTLQRQVVDAIRDLSRAEKYDLILSAGVIYASDRVDVTGKVLDRLKRMK